MKKIFYYGRFMLLIIDNTKNLKKAYMTPKLLKFLDSFNIKYTVLSKREDVKIFLEDNALKESIKGIILTGGPLCLSEELTIGSINKNIAIILAFPNIPILGICFGFQIMVASYGGKIKSMKEKKCGNHKIIIKNTDTIFKDCKNEEIVYQNHQDKVVDVPPCFNIIGISDDNSTIQAIESIELKRWGVQFHPEGLETTLKIIKNFWI